MNKLQRALEEQKQSTKQEVPQIDGTLGIKLDGAKQVEVSNRNGYVYVKLRNNPNEVIQAFNNQVSPSYGLPVLVERRGNKYIVAGVDTERYENNWNSFSAYLPRHGNTHSFDIESGGGGDIVWVYPRQFMPLLVFPSGSLGGPDVIVSSYTLKRGDGTWAYVGNTGTSNITSYNPSSSTGAIMVLVYLDANSGNPYLLIGSGTVFNNIITGSSQIYQYIPQVTDSTTQIPLAAVRLITGTSQISWDNIYDVRQWLHTSPTGTGGGAGSVAIQDEGVAQGSATTFNFVGDNVQATVAGSVARVFITGSIGGGINTGTLDARYLKLDASNDPLTGPLNVNVFDFPIADTAALSVVANDPDYNGIALDGESHGNYGLGLITFNYGVIAADQDLSDGLVHTEEAIIISRYSESGTSTLLSPAINIADDYRNINYAGGTLKHTISGTVELLRINPQATGTVIPYILNTQYSKPTGTIHTSWRVDGNEIAYLDANGILHSRFSIGNKRLSLVSATPHSTTDQLAKTTIYWTDGNTNLSVAVPSTTNTPFDIFCDASNNTLSTVDWTNDTTRATALAYNTYGYLAKVGDANKIYLGTGRTTGVSGQCADAGGDSSTTAAYRYLWNYYNQTYKKMSTSNSNASWTYGTATWRESNGGTGALRANFIVGYLNNPVINMGAYLNYVPDAGVTAYRALGVDAVDGSVQACPVGKLANAVTAVQGGDVYQISAIGHHFISVIEYAGGNTTFYGTLSGYGNMGIWM